MELIFWFVVGVMAVYRISLLVTQEDGPFNLALMFRNLFTTPNWIGRGVRCFWCVSFWISFLVAIPVALWNHLTPLPYLILSLGMGGLAVYFYENRWKR